MNVLVTGAAGFVGFHLVNALLEKGECVVGIDNLNDYYDPLLKNRRLEEILRRHQAAKTKRYKFITCDVSDKDDLKVKLGDQRFDVVIHLAAQAGVRYSLENPGAYIDSNLVGFFNIIEMAKRWCVEHFLYASSSSVYGMNDAEKFSESDVVDYPVSLYAATKKSNELIAHTYSHLYGMPVTGLRFFTVYGDWGRPDMAYFSFTKKILNGEVIELYNGGEMKRDFTHISDIIKGVVSIIDSPPPISKQNGTKASSRYRVLNIGNNRPVSLMHFVQTLEELCGKEAKVKKLPMQAGDVPATYADIKRIQNLVPFRPSITIEEGLVNFVEWYKWYYDIK